ncbi:hypothetical protein BGZ92_008971, partial [Podila epicladia]
PAAGGKLCAGTFQWVPGFFAKPGIKIEMEKEVYLPSWPACPDVSSDRRWKRVPAHISGHLRMRLRRNSIQKRRDISTVV